MRSRSCLLFALVLLPLIALADLKADLDQLLAAPALQRATTAVVVMRADTGETVYERNADLLLQPASNTKLVTSAAALDRFGPDFTVTTPLLRRGEVTDGVLNGELVFVGRGDPALELRHLDELAAKVAAAGIRRVTGRVLYDTSFFDDDRVGDNWALDDTRWYYGAEISPLMVERNAFAVFAKAGAQPGAPVEIRVTPPSGLVRVLNFAVTGPAGSRPSFAMVKQPGHNVLIFRGSLPAGTEEQRQGVLAVANSPEWAARLLTEALRAKGVQVANEPAATLARPTDVTVAEVTGEPMSRVLALFNKPSDNLIGETLLKLMGRAEGGAGTAPAGLAVVREFLAKAGIEPDAHNFWDGSGLSRSNMVSARSLAKLLIYMRGHRHAKVYFESLPVAGVDGTMRNRLKESEAKGGVVAKTGSLRAVSALSGYVTTRSGRPYVISVIMNRFAGPTSEVRAIQDAIAERVFKENEN